MKTLTQTFASTKKLLDLKDKLDIQEQFSCHSGGRALHLWGKMNHIFYKLHFKTQFCKIHHPDYEGWSLWRLFMTDGLRAQDKPMIIYRHTHTEPCSVSQSSVSCAWIGFGLKEEVEVSGENPDTRRTTCKCLLVCDTQDKTFLYFKHNMETKCKTRQELH